MIIAKLKWNTPLYKVDEFVTKLEIRLKISNLILK